MTNETMHTTKAVYAIFLKWPDDNMLKLADLIPYIMEEDVEISMIKPHDVLEVSDLIFYSIINDIEKHSNKKQN